MRVLVTGATGFLGRNTVEALRKAGHEPVATARRGAGAVELDLLDPCAIGRVLDAVRPDAVINCAASMSWAEGTLPSLLPVNTLAPGLIAAWCSERGVRLVHCSGTLVYGSREQAISAASPERPDTDYGRSKLLGDQLVAASGANAAVVRFCGMYGPDGPSHLGLNRAIAAARQGKVPSIVGRGLARRNYLYVKDAASLLVACLERARTGILVASSHEVCTIGQTLRTLCDVFLPGSVPQAAEGPEAMDQVVEPSADMIGTRTVRQAFEDMR